MSVELVVDWNWERTYNLNIGNKNKQIKLELNQKKEIYIMANGPKLTCVVSGKSRPTTWDYLKNKAKRLNITVSDLMKYYVCRDVVTRYNKDHLDPFDMVAPDCVSGLRGILQNMSFDELVLYNSRSKTKTSKPTENNTTLENVRVDVVEVESKLSPDTEAYLKQKEELIGKEKLEEIHTKVWGDDDAVTVDDNTSL